MEELKLVIVEDDGDKIQYGKIEEVIRTETMEVENAIAELETEIAEKNARLEELKAKIAFNKYVIEYADKLRAEAEEKARLEAENTEETNEEVTEEVVE